MATIEEKKTIAGKINEMIQDAFVSGYQKGFRDCYEKYQVAIEKALETCYEVKDGMDCASREVGDEVDDN